MARVNPESLLSLSLLLSLFLLPQKTASISILFCPYKLYA